MLFEFLKDHHAIIGWLGLLSVLTFFGSLLIIPWLIARIPVDYFQYSKRSPFRSRVTFPTLDLILTVIKNIFGVLFILAGLSMLFLPGQGIQTILIGLMMTNFPGKYKLEKKMVCRRSVQRVINWIRYKYHKPPLEFHPERECARQ